MLTPDRVGSTMLQRVLTVYMLRRGFDKPVINLHELSNGIEKYYNTELNQEVLGKPKNIDQVYYQSLSEVIELLDNADHYKTSRLAHYHLVKRQDSIAEQLSFYEDLNNNFYIISCRRRNLFEHAISWAINAHTKRLNVYSAQEKVEVFNELYQNPITVSRELIWSKLDDYKNYVEWCNRYFNVQSYFNYEDSINNLEEYIMNLDFMRNSKNNTWNDMFGQDFDEWNKMHKTIPDLLLKNEGGDTRITPYTALISDWDATKGSDWPKLPPPDLETADLPVAIKEDIKSKLNLPTLYVSEEKATYIKKNLPKYKEAVDQIDRAKDAGFLFSNIPIKLQTFEEKKQLIKNFNDCIDYYNQWATRTGFADPYNAEEHSQTQQLEENKMNDFSNLLENKR